MSWQLITEQSEMDSLLERLMSKPAWGFDTETTGLDPHENKVILMQFGRPEEQYLIDVRKVNPEPLRPFFESREHKKIGHNLKFDYKMMKGTFGIEVEKLRCTMLAEKIINAGRRFSGFSLAALMETRLGKLMDKTMRDSFVGHTGEFTTKQLEYAALDVSDILQLSNHQCEDLRHDGLGPTWVLECNAIPCFGDMEYDGVILDVDHWKDLIKKNEGKREEVRQQLDEFAQNYCPVNLFGNVEINYASPKQVLELLQKMRVTISEVDQSTGQSKDMLIPNTNEKTLDKVKDNPFIELLKEYRHYDIRIGTFGYPYLEGIHPKTGRIHPEFHQIGTETGRPANHSKSPINMLNVPSDKEYRKGFKAPEDYLVETDDYSGCELRIWAELSEDPELVRAFQEDIDLHSEAATKLFGRKVTKENENKVYRKAAKPINFGIAYGMGPMSLYYQIRAAAPDLGLSFEDTKKLFRQYCDKEYPTGVQFLRNAGQKAFREGWLCNMNGRRRYWILPNADEREKFPNGENDRRYIGIKKSIEREGGNFTIQSVNADMTKEAMARIRDYKKEHGIRTTFLNQVYDEIVTVTHKDDSPDFHQAKQRIMKEAAEKWLKKVPMEVEGEVGPTWTK